MSERDGGPMFPTTQVDHNLGPLLCGGATLWDLYASAALNGILAGMGTKDLDEPLATLSACVAANLMMQQRRKRKIGEEE